MGEQNDSLPVSDKISLVCVCLYPDFCADFYLTKYSLKVKNLKVVSLK